MRINVTDKPQDGRPVVLILGVGMAEPIVLQANAMSYGTVARVSKSFGKRLGGQRNQTRDEVNAQVVNAIRTLANWTLPAPEGVQL